MKETIGKTTLFLTRFYSQRFEVSERRSCFTLRLLSKNPDLCGSVAAAIKEKINSGTIMQKELFRFSVPVIEMALANADVPYLVGVISNMWHGKPLPLYIDKNCYYDPFYTGVGRSTLLYYLLPEGKRASFMVELREKSPSLYEMCDKAMKTNPLFKFQGNDDERKMAVIHLVERWDIVGPRAYTSKARYYRLQHPGRPYIIR